MLLNHSHILVLLHTIELSLTGQLTLNIIWVLIILSQTILNTSFCCAHIAHFLGRCHLVENVRTWFIFLCFWSIKFPHEISLQIWFFI